MFGFLSRLFGGNNNIVKDPDLGKVRYLESPNGSVWSGRLKSVSTNHVIQYFIESEEKVLKHQPKNRMLDNLSGEIDFRNDIDQYFISERPLSRPANFQIDIIHVPESIQGHDIQWICASPESEFSVYFLDGKVVEVNIHERDVTS